ncbi:MAG: FKBP-type peptidyl-prolyl cis-trans isomerase [Candidatus Micrarchaeia archaeon]
MSEVVARKGDKVAVDYVGLLEDGTVFDSSLRDEAEKAGLPTRASWEPLEFVLGEGEVIKGFDAAIQGMREGEFKEFRVSPEDAYGFFDPNLVQKISFEALEENGVDAEVGVVLWTPNGFKARIVSVDAETRNATLDFNHELAGKTLVFRVWLKKIFGR